MKDKIEKILISANVPFEFISLPEDLPMDVESHMKFHSKDLKYAMPNIVFKTEKGFVVAQRRGDTKLDSKKLKKILGVKDLRTATPSELSQLNLEVGIVPPVGFEARFVMDKQIFENDFVYTGTGHKLFAIKLNPSDVKRVNNAEVADFTENATNKRVLSGMRASGRLHLGNYLGGAKGMLALQNDSEYETLYMVADVHGITAPYKVEELRKNKLEMVKDYLSVGLDPEKSILFMQSSVPEHVELTFYLSSVVTMYRMQHLPTFKEEVRKHPDNVTMALLNYPVLMASDILIYKSGLVPVGIDQEPHLEVAREIARKMNETYGTDFPEPTRFATKGEYVPSLLGEGKMSKSVEGSYISLTDDLDAIRKKLSIAPTNSGKGSLKVVQASKNNVPYNMVLDENGTEAKGVDALLKFVDLFEGEKKRKEYEKMYESSGIKYSELKEDLANAIDRELKPIQERRKVYENDPSLVERILNDGAEKAREIASKTVEEVKEKMGLV